MGLLDYDKLSKVTLVDVALMPVSWLHGAPRAALLRSFDPSP